MPRLAWLAVELNGVSGSAHPVPRPSTSSEIRLHAGGKEAAYSLPHR